MSGNGPLRTVEIGLNNHGSRSGEGQKFMELSEDAAGDCFRLPVSPLTAAPSATIASLGRRLSDEITAARSYRRQAKSANTIRSYASDWRQFETWCNERDLEFMPARPEAVATYLASLATAGRADSTVTRHLAVRSAGGTPRTGRQPPQCAMRTC